MVVVVAVVVTDENEKVGRDDDWMGRNEKVSRTHNDLEDSLDETEWKEVHESPRDDCNGS